MIDTSTEAVESVIGKLTRLGQIPRESAANGLPLTGVTNRDGLNIASLIQALLAERDRLREALQEIADDGTTDVLVDEPEGRLWTVRQTEAARIAMRALGEDRT